MRSNVMWNTALHRTYALYLVHSVSFNVVLCLSAQSTSEKKKFRLFAPLWIRTCSLKPESDGLPSGRNDAIRHLLSRFASSASRSHLSAMLRNRRRARQVGWHVMAVKKGRLRWFVWRRVAGGASLFTPLTSAGSSACICRLRRDWF